MENSMLPCGYPILSVEKVTRAEYTFRVAYHGNAQPGQFFQLSIPKAGEAPISVSGFGDGFVEFTISRVGRLTDEIFGLDAGDTLFMRGPYGKPFPVEDFKGKDLVVICGGTGLAPVRSTLNHFYDHPGEVRSVWLIAGFKNPEAVLFTEELERFRTRFHVYTTLDEGEAPGFDRGLVTAAIGNVPFREFEDYNVAIVGPPVMMHFAALECLKHGAAEEKMWLSFSRKMSCALGKCGHCKINETYVCLEGPVFNYTRAKALFD